MLQKELNEHICVLQTLATMQDKIDDIVKLLVKTILCGNTVFVCGNGGSAADAQHFAAEIIGRFKKERRAWPAVALTTDTSILTAIGNDYGFDEIFARQLEGLGRANDILLGISTSGDSPNVIKAVNKAESLNIQTIGLLGKDGGSLAKTMDLHLVIKSYDTARIQEAHIFLIHYIAGRLEEYLMEK